MGKIQFMMDTNGHCFLCLQLVKSSKQNQAKLFSFRNVCQYLKINIRDVAAEAMPISSISSKSPTILEKAELKGFVCEACGPLFEQFSRNYLELEGIKMKLKYSLKSIYDKMMAVDRLNEDMDPEEFEKQMLIRHQTSLRSQFVEQLRRKTLQRCSTIIERGRPFVEIQKLKLAAIGHPRAREPASTSTSAMVNQPSKNLQMARKTKGIKRRSQPKNPNKKMFQCDICPRKFPLRFNLELHKRRVHLTQTEKAKDSDLSSDSSVEFEPIRTRSHKPEMETKITDDADSSTSISTLPPPCLIEAPIQITAENGRDPKQKCKLCSKKFNSKSTMRQHLIHFHRAKHECDSCDKVFKHELSLYIHEQIIHVRRIHQCQFCLEKFCHSLTRDRHMETSCPMRDSGSSTPSGEMPLLEIQVDAADLQIPNNSDATSSIQDKPDLQPEAMNIKVEDVESSDMDMECDVCQEKVSDPLNHKCTHFETTLKINDLGEVEGEEVIPKLPQLEIIPPISPSKKQESSVVNSKGGLHKCRICSREFQKEMAFQDHFKHVHLRIRYKCNLCGRDYPYRSEYTRHHRAVHVGTRYKCDLCSKMFAQKEVLLEHRRNVHFRDGGGGQSNANEVRGMASKIKALKCLICAKEFKYRKRLEEHQATAHPKAKPRYKCKLCGKEFAERSKYQSHNARFHMHMDANAKKLKCDICYKNFSTVSNLNKHNRIFHPPGQEEKLGCPNCLKRFSSVSNRNQHIRLKRCMKEKVPTGK